MLKTIRKVAHLTSVHPRYDTRIYLKECISLAKKGYLVSLVVADGNGDELKNDVDIFDVGASNGRLDRVFNAPKRVYQKAIELDADLYHFHDPELIPIAMKLKKLGRKVVFDIHENTDLQILSKEWIPFCLRRPISWLYSKYEVYTCKKFDALVVPQIAMKKKFSKYARTEIVANFPTEAFSDIKAGQPSKYNLLYAGGLNKARGLYNMLNLIEHLSNIDRRYTLTLAGPIEKKELAIAETHPGWKNTVYHGVISRRKLYELYSKNSIGLILFNNVGQYYMSYALKLFEYMQCGMTVIMPDFGDWLVFNDKFKTGFNVRVTNSIEIAKLLHNLDPSELLAIKEHNSHLAFSEFLWGSQEKKLFSLYESIYYG